MVIGTGSLTSAVVAALVTLGASTPANTQTAPDPPAAPPVAQQRSSPFEHILFGAALEGDYQYNWNRPLDRVNLLRAYDTRANVFGIQQAALVIESAPAVDQGRRFGARIDLQFGQATDTVQGSAANEPRPDVYRNVWQAYGTYIFPVGRGLQTDFGKFGSMLGYETNYAKDNNQFSRAYLFNFLPFYHSGVRASLPVTDKVTLLYMLTNGIQQTEDFNNFKSNHFATIIKPDGRVTWTASYYFGQEQPEVAVTVDPRARNGWFTVVDSYVSWTATPRASFGVDVNYVTNQVHQGDPALSLQGLGAYARYQTSSPSALSLRYERLDDEGLFGGIAQVLQELTATAEFKFAEGFLVRGEVRRDWSNEAFFTARAAGELRAHQNTALVGLVWWFGNKTGAW